MSMTHHDNHSLEQQVKIDELKTQLSLQRDRNKALEIELTISRNYGDGLRSQLNDMMLRHTEKMIQAEGLQRRIGRALLAINDPEAQLCDQAWFALKALRGEHV